MSFNWSCFIVPSFLEICSFIVISVCLSSFNQSMRKKKTKKQRQKKNKRKKKKEKREKNINKCTRICIQYKYPLSSYVDL